MPDTTPTTVCECGHPPDRHTPLSGVYAHCRWKYTEAGRGKCFCGMYRPQREAAAPARQVCGTTDQQPETTPTNLREQLRTEFGKVLRRWGLLDEVNDPQAAEEFAVTDLLSVLPAPTNRAASPAPLASALPTVQGRCPACGTAGLFLGDGGYVTCSLIDCPAPDAASTVLERPRADEAQQPKACACDYISESWIKMRHAAGCPAEPALAEAQQPETEAAK